MLVQTLVSLFTISVVAAIPQSSGSTPTFYYRISDKLPNERCPNVQRADVEFKNAYTSCGLLLSDVGKYGAAISGGSNHCGKKIQVKSDSGKTLTLTVVDTCPACDKDNHVDISLDALVELFDGDSTKACGIDRTVPQISWNFI